MGAKCIATRFHVTLILLSLILSGSGRASVIGVLDKNAPGLVSQPQSTAVEAPSPSTSEAFLEQVRVNSRRQAAEAAFNLSVIAAGRMDFTLAGTLIEEAIQLNPSNLDYLRAAAGIAYSTREYDKAEEYQLTVLEIARSALGPDDLRVAAVLDELGIVYVAQNRYSEAESLLKQSLAIREQGSGKMHPSIAGSLNNLAGFAMQGGRFDEAEQLLKRALHILETSVDTDPSDTAMAMHNLGDLHANQKRFSEANALYQRAMLVWKEAPAKDRLELAATLNELGSFYHSQQRLDEAKPQFELVITLLSGDFGQDHPHVRTAMSGLDYLKIDREKRSEVKDFSQKMFDELRAQLSERNRVN
jgi:tetratricopeptide (TPR) repeat protein